jgi:hypothetical protein
MRANTLAHKGDVMDRKGRIAYSREMVRVRIEAPCEAGAVGLVDALRATAGVEVVECSRWYENRGGLGEGAYRGRRGRVYVTAMVTGNMP